MFICLLTLNDQKNEKISFGSIVSFGFITLNSFTTISVRFAKTCTYRVYDVKSGATLGFVEIKDMPDNVPCNDKRALDAALATWEISQN